MKYSKLFHRKLMMTKSKFFIVHLVEEHLIPDCVEERRWREGSYFLMNPLDKLVQNHEDI